MKLKSISDDFRKEIIDWCKYNYGGNLIGLALFDPTGMDANYPSSDINVLMVVGVAPENARDRYEIVTEELMQTIARNRSLSCRVQTIDELKMLADLGLPLFDIYLRDAEIIFDPKKILENERAKLK